MATATIDKEAVGTLIERARREIDEGLLPSCQLALARDGEVVEHVTLGDAPLGDDTRYVIFSCTKAIVYAATWQLLAEGSLRLDQLVAELIPEFAANGKDAVTVEQVMTHCGGFPLAPIGPHEATDRAARLERFAKWRLTTEPGVFAYHATSAHWVLAELIERIDGDDYRRAVGRRVFEPLSLKRSALGVPVEHQGDINRAVVVGEPATAEEFEAATGVKGFDTMGITDEALASLGEPDAIAAGVPGAGAVSTAGDLALFYQALLHNPGALWDPAWLNDATSVVRVTAADPLAGFAPANRTIGMVVAGDDGRGAARLFGHTAGPRSFGYNGAGGQIGWADPDSGLSFAYLTNGLDRNLLRYPRRMSGLSSKAAVCIG
ncbi:MAG: serine hydrolase domain-containing protein [Actinomycetota bacterium]